MTTITLNSQTQRRRPWMPIRSHWPEWVGYAAAAWSLVYGLLALYWTFGGAGFPFGTENDPYAAKVSILEHVEQDAGALAIVVLGLGPRCLPLPWRGGGRGGSPARR
jgi:hypothetical protein